MNSRLEFHIMSKKRKLIEDDINSSLLHGLIPSYSEKNTIAKVSTNETSFSKGFRKADIEDSTLWKDCKSLDEAIAWKDVKSADSGDISLCSFYLDDHDAKFEGNSMARNSVQGINCLEPEDVTETESDQSNQAQLGNAMKTYEFSRRNSNLKRPRSAYIIYLDYCKVEYFEENPNASFNEYQKYAGKVWKSLSPAAKQVHILYVNDI